MAKGKKSEGTTAGPVAVKNTSPKKAPAALKPAPKQVDATPDRPVVAAPASAAPPAHDAIARRAYEIFCQRGGTAFDNWIEAERQLRE